MIGTEIFAQQLGWQESHHRTCATWTSSWARRGRSSCLERTGFLLKSEADPDRHPTRFMAQKLLIHDRRERRSRAKDILYLHDTIELFGASLDVLGEEWELAAKPELSESASRTVEASADTAFSKVTDDIRGAAQAAAGRALTPERIQELCRTGLKAVFGTATLHKP
jgi:hypothetical protein